MYRCLYKSSDVYTYPLQHIRYGSVDFYIKLLPLFVDQRLQRFFIVKCYETSFLFLQKKFYCS